MTTSNDQLCLLESFFFFLFFFLLNQCFCLLIVVRTNQALEFVHATFFAAAFCCYQWQRWDFCFVFVCLSKCVRFRGTVSDVAPLKTLALLSKPSPNRIYSTRSRLIVSTLSRTYSLSTITQLSSQHSHAAIVSTLPRSYRLNTLMQLSSQHSHAAIVSTHSRRIVSTLPSSCSLK